ncbi:hypothetical protein [Roseateles albus]|uniref:Uncharacterized protein n=1 Tax=Roseateles albus TaxID=2987525 RepID=A0ABT5KIA0_9BURK|nr:hypothetical protein [Roseateles albus]MDC8773174.1 hypothetical protein [Roseateles albus]
MKFKLPEFQATKLSDYRPGLPTQPQEPQCMTAWWFAGHVPTLCGSSKKTTASITPEPPIPSDQARRDGAKAALSKSPKTVFSAALESTDFAPNFDAMGAAAL